MQDDSELFSKGTDISDERLVLAALAVANGMPTREAAKAAGISHQTFAAWRQGPLRPEEFLHDRTREKLRRYLTEAGRLPESPPEHLTEREIARVRGVARRIDRGARKLDRGYLLDLAEEMRLVLIGEIKR